MSEIPTFRAAKRRKVFAREKFLEQDDPADQARTSSLVVQPHRQTSTRKTGVQFTNSDRDRSRDETGVNLELARAHPEDGPSLKGLQNRFVGAGGSTRTVDVDKHMYV